MSFSDRVRAWLTFHRNERKAMLGMVMMIGLCYALPWLISQWYPAHSITVEITALDSLLGEDSVLHTQADPKRHSAVSAELFYFDPNQATLEDWLRLGIPAHTAQVILHYREKGGRFRKKEDLLKIYGLRQADYQRLAPYIRIPDQAQKRLMRHDSTQVLQAGSVFQHNQSKKQLPAQQKVELNSADTLLLMQLPGIGPAFARHIIRYRERLGGFYSVAQLTEVPSLPDSIVSRILPRVEVDTSLLRPLDLNKAQIGELATHPYVGYALARLIIAYREQHGPYRDIADLQKLVLVNEQIYRKLVHYLVVNPAHHESRAQ
ncbi:MAG: helix-hairpin-helix domain-containing protein [Thermoflavifilum sp.]|nr:helix-hairpin-helix domain-containing protein [Thermoflavifilum sp.]